VKKNLYIIFALLVNMFIAYSITSILGIENIVLFQPMTALNYTITYEIIIWYVLILIEYAIYKYLLSKIKINDKIKFDKVLQKIRRRKYVRLF